MLLVSASPFQSEIRTSPSFEVEVGMTSVVALPTVLLTRTVLENVPTATDDPEMIS
jgi:hypothetical protein